MHLGQSEDVYYYILYNNSLYVLFTKTVVLLFFHLSFFVPPLFAGVLRWSLIWYALLCVLSSFVIILTRKRELDALLLLFFGCLVTVNVLWLFLMVPWLGLQCVIVVFPDHIHLML